ncbi:winged helix-turn-helix transcriptional regulator [Asticcacaulis sp. AC460]|uniref:winged helix-turn-helix transcriptional regulator n=1 Tax=Asticcacaulis sp. AC460 TaxID=1282360 RepID=UPI0004CEA8F8|nr:helix-turn-helix domain-containing protein [Asticcacaulis sp. AC460]
MGRSADYSKQNCAIAATLDIVGEPWTLLIIRDAFKGIARFEQWQDSLGMARNVLAARLKHLVAHGIFEMRIYCDRPKRHEYLLTDKGHELRPMILHMLDWGKRNVYGEEVPATGLIHSCGHELHPVSHCAHCQEALKRGDVTEKLNPDAPSIGELYERSPEAAES